MPLTTENTSGLVGGAAIPAMQKRWVKVLRTFVGSKAAKGEVVELDGRFAAELAAANKVVYVPAPVEAPAAAEVAPPAPQEPAAAPIQLVAPRRGRASREN